MPLSTPSPETVLFLAACSDLAALRAARPDLARPDLGGVPADFAVWRTRAVLDGVAEVFTVGREGAAGISATSTEFRVAFEAFLAALEARPAATGRVVILGAGGADPVAGPTLLFSDTLPSPAGAGPARFSGGVPLAALRGRLDARLPGRPIDAVLDVGFTGPGRCVTPTAPVEDAPRLRDLDRCWPARVGEAVREIGGRGASAAIAEAGAFAEVDPTVDIWIDIVAPNGDVLGHVVFTGPGYVGPWPASADNWHWNSANIWPDEFRLVPRSTQPSSSGVWLSYQAGAFPSGTGATLPNPVPDGKLYKISRISGGTTITMDAHVWRRTGPIRFEWYAADSALSNYFLKRSAGDELKLVKTTTPSSSDPQHRILSAAV